MWFSMFRNLSYVDFPVLRLRLAYPTPLLILRLRNAYGDKAYVGEIERRIMLPKSDVQDTGLWDNEYSMVIWMGNVTAIDPKDDLGRVSAPGSGETGSRRVRLHKRGIFRDPYTVKEMNSESSSQDDENDDHDGEENSTLHDSDYGLMVTAIDNVKAKEAAIGLSMDQQKLWIGTGRNRAWTSVLTNTNASFPVPDGTYVFELVVFKPMPLAEHAYDIWYSPVFKIKRNQH
jgi:hypothetical protein